MLLQDKAPAGCSAAARLLSCGPGMLGAGSVRVRARHAYRSSRDFRYAGRAGTAVACCGSGAQFGLRPL
jgi:hypothetical protein